MQLVIVESPTKAKTIGKFLGDGYRVESSYGHIRDLPKSALGINLEENFEPQYVVPAKAKSVVAKLKKEAKASERVILATDEDREGEAIAWHLVQALGLNAKQSQKPKAKIPNIQRIVFHEITKTAIEEALKHPRGIDAHLVDAQQARRVLDRLVGYKLSPFLWRKVARGLSAGRVQSVAVRLIMDREYAIRNFKQEEYWSIAALFTQKPPVDASRLIEAFLVKRGDQTLDKFAIRTKEEAERLRADLEGAAYRVESVEQKTARKNPPPPFTTSTLQQEGAKRLGFTAKKTMFIAQRLYENGYITYMRTDSVNLSRESLAAAKAWIEGSLGERYAREAPRAYQTKSKLSQEAHEAIRPTDVNRVPDGNGLADAGDRKLYDLIWRRFVASQLPQAEISAVIAEIAATPRAGSPKAPSYVLRATGQRVAFDGYLRIWPQKFTERDLPALKKGESLDLHEVRPEQHFTEPPPRYTEATLVKTLEEFGIGRPSTYAPIISVIQARNYVQKEKGRFQPTEMGELVNKVLTEHFPEIVDVDFTAKMEGELDGIAGGEVEWRNVIRGFYDPFAKRLAEKYEVVSKRELTTEETNEKCEKCGKPMVIRMGRFGRFLACTGFPECKNTKKLAGNNNGGKAPPQPIGMKCPKCLASPDPAQRDTPGEVVIRVVGRGRARGKRFWGCSRYPKCDYATWEDPLAPPSEKNEGVERKGRAKSREQGEKEEAKSETTSPPEPA